MLYKKAIVSGNKLILSGISFTTTNSINQYGIRFCYSGTE